MGERSRKVKNMKVLHRTPTFGLDVQIMTPLSVPERCAHDLVSGHVGGPWGPILHVKTMKSQSFGFFFNFNQKSNKNPLRFTFSSMVERSRKVKKNESIAQNPNFCFRCAGYGHLKEGLKGARMIRLVARLEAPGGQFSL